VNWFVYILQCGDGSFYTGVTTDISRRLSEHETGVLGAKYTRARGPFLVVYTKVCMSRSEAQKQEAAIKKLSKSAKSELIAQQFD